MKMTLNHSKNGMVFSIILIVIFGIILALFFLFIFPFINTNLIREEHSSNRPDLEIKIGNQTYTPKITDYEWQNNGKKFKKDDGLTAYVSGKKLTPIETFHSNEGHLQFELYGDTKIKDVNITLWVDTSNKKKLPINRDNSFIIPPNSGNSVLEIILTANKGTQTYIMNLGDN